MTPRLDERIEAAIIAFGGAKWMQGRKGVTDMAAVETLYNELCQRIADISLTPEEAQAVVYYLDYYNVAEEIVHRLPVNTALGKLRTLAAASPLLSSDTTK